VSGTVLSIRQLILKKGGKSLSYVYLDHCNKIHSSGHRPRWKYMSHHAFLIRVQRSPRMHSTASYLAVLFVLDLCKIHNETFQVPSTSTCPFAFARSSHFQSWSGVSNQVVFKACNVSARCLCSVTYIKFVMEQPKRVKRKTVHSIDQVVIGGPRKEVKDIIPLFYSL